MKGKDSLNIILELSLIKFKNNHQYHQVNWLMIPYLEKIIKKLFL